MAEPRPRLLPPDALAAIAARYAELLPKHLALGWNEREQAYADDVPDLLGHIAALTQNHSPQPPEEGTQPNGK